MGIKARYLIVGLGAVGSVLAVTLAEARSEEVIAITRNNEGCRSETINVVGLGEARLRVCGWDVVRELGVNATIVLIATKAYDVPAVISSLKHSKVQADLFVSFQNGLGSLELLEKTFGTSRVAAGIVYFGATRLGKVVELRGRGGIVLGCRYPPCNPLLGELATDLRKGGLDVRDVGWIEPYRWLKLAVNAAINPLTAIVMRENGFILEDKKARQLAESIVLEVTNVASKLQIPLPRDPIQELYTVLRLTQNNLSSMLQDLLQCKPTEVDYINGAIALKAKEVGVDAKTNEALWLLVKMLERAHCTNNKFVNEWTREEVCGGPAGIRTRDFRPTARP